MGCQRLGRRKREGGGFLLFSLEFLFFGFDELEENLKKIVSIKTEKGSWRDKDKDKDKDKNKDKD